MSRTAYGFTHPFGKPTETGVDEAVPHASVSPDQPPSTEAGSEAQRGAEYADQHVADADVEKKHIHRSPQCLELAEEDEDDEVAKKAKNHDQSQKHRHHGVSPPRQGVGWLIAPFWFNCESVVAARVGAAIHT